MANTAEKEVDLQAQTLTLPVGEKVKVSVDTQTKVKGAKKTAANNNTFDQLFEIQGATKVISAPTGRRTEREKEVEETMKNCDLLAEKHRKYNADYIVRGNEALYEVLTDIYKMAVQLDKSDYKHEIHAKLRAILKERDIKTQMNTPELTLIIKYVVGGDRKRATNYSRVLKIALMEGLPPEELSNYISRRGGIGQIFDTEANSIAQDLGKKVTKERLALMKEYLLLSQWEEPVEFKYDKPIIQHNDHKMTRAETSTFAVFLTDYDPINEVYRVISGHDLGRTYEDCVLRFIIKGATGDIEKIKAGITRYKRKLLDANVLPKGLVEKFSEQLQKVQ
jgi:hypothetical protein